MPTAARSDLPETLGFLLLPKFSMMAFVSAVEPLRVANRLAGAELYRWEIVSLEGASIAASNGMSLVADRNLGQLGRGPSRYRTVVVGAGFEPEQGYDRRIRDWLRRLDRNGVELGAMDTGSFVLARAGLLDGYRATTHWEVLDSFREQFPKVEAEGGLFAIDRNRLTCAGGTAALDMMLHVISRRHGHRLATAVSEQFIHARIRDPQDRQRMEPAARQGVSHAGLGRAIALMEKNLEEPLDAGRMARAAGLSQRQLERLFRLHLNTTPQRYYLDLRLQRARALLQYSEMPVVEVAVACGFGSAAHFSRSYHAWAGRSPRAERRPGTIGA
ncbi:AraC family transcriptional regulator [Hypericibacter terrae]|uniref:AraC family transcriptional regulator n=1 Tax=Hypericibacter terrae TaxID=2602015 RepID=A0A5J6MJL9_9PROT|nr:GlxA family transcriptional regulator [Hypericibacter terrae]QEX17457.1 AraC family transcriptional regulator [Hypericibacter terrae]